MTNKMKRFLTAMMVLVISISMFIIPAQAAGDYSPEVTIPVTVKLTGTMLEITPDNFAAALTCATVHKEGSVTTLRVRTDVQDADYIPSLCWIGDTSQGFVLIELTNVLNLKGAAFTFTDKGEGTLPFEFQAHQADFDAEEAPLRVMFIN